MIKLTLLIFIFIIIGCDLSFQLPPLESRIIGGQDAKIQEVPYQLSLFYFNTLIGGASIISSRWAITAAHCVNKLDAKDLKVGAGHEKINMGKFYNILKVYQHKSYNKNTLDNDIALLEIDGTFLFGNDIRAVNLPNSNIEPQNDLKVTISGWGATNLKEFRRNIELKGLLPRVTFPQTLKQVTVSIIDRKVCKQKYSKIRPVSNNMICAGDAEKGGKDACLNDSGGPMVADNKLYGIVSWGKECGNPQYPGVYTHVAKYRDWIKKITNL